MLEVKISYSKAVWYVQDIFTMKNGLSILVSIDIEHVTSEFNVSCWNNLLDDEEGLMMLVKFLFFKPERSLLPHNKFYQPIIFVHEQFHWRENVNIWGKYQVPRPSSFHKYFLNNFKTKVEYTCHTFLLSWISPCVCVWNSRNKQWGIKGGQCSVPWFLQVAP